MIGFSGFGSPQQDGRPETAGGREKAGKAAA